MNEAAANLSRLSQLLDQSMDLSGPELNAWLAALPPEHAALEPQLRLMLEARCRTGALLPTHLPKLDPGGDAGDGVAVGDAIGPYRVLKELGHGGMGSVWLAERAEGGVNRQVALKLPRIAWSEGLAKRMARECAIGARLEHPGIARLYDAGADERGWPYLAFEYIEGEAIDIWCRERATDLRARVALVLQVARAVAYAHARLIVHRDLKPSNVLVSPDGRSHLLDFGIASWLRSDAGNTADDGLTRAQGRPLTLQYASPELLRGGPVTVAADVWSLGVLAYELFAEARPFAPRRSSAAALEEAILQADPPGASSRAPARLAKGLRGDLDAILAKALRHEPEERYASADAFADDLQRHLDHAPVVARPASVAYRLRKFVRRRRVGVATTAAVTAAALLAGGQVLSHRRQTEVSQAQSRTASELLRHVFSGMSPDAAEQSRFTARELLERAQQYLDSHAAAQPEIRDQARWRMAELFEEVGAYDNAARIYRAAEEQASARSDLSAAGEALLMLADVEMRAGRNDAAQATLQRLPPAALENPIIQARRLVLEGELHIDRGRHRDAISALEQAQQLLQANGSQDALLQARTAQVLATALQRDVQLERAREQLLQALLWQDRRQPASPVDRLVVEKDLGTVESWLGRYDSAERTLERVYRELRARLGPARDHTATASTELAYAQVRRGRLDAAAALAHQAIAELQPHARLAGSVQFMKILLARISMYRGDAAAAAKQLEALLVAMVSSEGGPTPASEPVRRMLGEALLRDGKTAAALAVLRNTESNQLRLSGPDHATVAATRIVLATALARLGRREEAQHLWRAAHAVLTRQYPRDHLFVVACAAYLALATPLAAAERGEAARGLRERLGWQPGARELATWIESDSGSAADWSHLPVVL